MLTKEDVGSVVVRELRSLLLEQPDAVEAGELGDLTGDAYLHELGVNSLMLARLLVQLEGELGTDPFSGEGSAISDIRSVNDLITAYLEALAG